MDKAQKEAKENNEVKGVPDYIVGGVVHELDLEDFLMRFVKRVRANPYDSSE